jgi:hypothetical protein
LETHLEGKKTQAPIKNPRTEAGVRSSHVPRTRESGYFFFFAGAFLADFLEAAFLVAFFI